MSNALEQDELFAKNHSDEELELLEKVEENEVLKKHTCVRCSNSVSTKGGRCSSCLKKLRIAKKTPGHWQRSQTKFDDLRRREKGKNGTAKKKSKGLAESRQKFVKKFKSDEKKTGQKLSPDRRNNKLGYAKSNVRNVKESLNRGRHTVDPKKLAAWRKTIKKSNISLDDLMTLLQAHAIQNGNETLAKTLENIDITLLLSELGILP